MGTFRKPTAVIFLILFSLLFSVMACTLSDLGEKLGSEIGFESDSAKTQDVLEVIEVTETASVPIPTAIPETAFDGKLTFSYSGDNQPYHPGLRDQTVFYIDYDTGKVVANQSVSFEVPYESQTAIGTDTITFEGAIRNMNEISGELRITTSFSTVSDSKNSTTTSFKYVMYGTLSAMLENDQWLGTVTGTSSITQSWHRPDGWPATMREEYDIDWTVIGTPVE